MSKQYRIGWYSSGSADTELAEFFSRNVSPSYISHSELQSGRADLNGTWSPHIIDIIRKELSERATPGIAASDKILTAYDDQKLIGLAYVKFDVAAPTPFLVIEDIIVDDEHRGNGLGEMIIKWIISEGIKLGIKSAFLESGKDNEKAHKFFARMGFYQTSIVMMAKL